MLAITFLQAQHTYKKFTGEWQWKGGDNEEINLVIKQVCFNHPVTNFYSCDLVYIWHEYKKDGKIVETTMPYINDSIRIGTKRFGLGVYRKEGGMRGRVLELGVKDSMKNKYEDVRFSYICTRQRINIFKYFKKVTAKWTLSEYGGERLIFSEDSRPKQGFTYPVDAIFIKKNAKIKRGYVNIMR